MSKEIVIDCNSNGTVEGLHFDAFDLGFLGRKHVERASEIFHNAETDLWDILLPSQGRAYPEVQGFSGYDTARRFEVLWLQDCRKLSIDPIADEDMARVRARLLRADFIDG